MVALFKVDYEGFSNNIFDNDIKCVCYVFNIVVNNIMTMFLDTLDDETLCKWFFTYKL